MTTNCGKCGDIRVCDEFSKMCLECEKALVAAAFESDDPAKADAVLSALLPKIQQDEVDDENDFNVPDSDRRYHGDEYTGE